MLNKRNYNAVHLRWMTVGLKLHIKTKDFYYKLQLQYEITLAVIKQDQ